MVEERIITESKIESKDAASTGQDWFQMAQEYMINHPGHEIDQLIGKLYSLSKKAADQDNDRFMRNPDAEAFANAYYQALDSGKHGTKIILPSHLHCQLPIGLRKYLTCPHN